MKQADVSETMVPSRSSNEDLTDKYKDSSSKKRVAYEQADVRPKYIKTHTVGKNHSQIAMEVSLLIFIIPLFYIINIKKKLILLQSILKRQELARKQLEEMQRKEEADKAAEAKRIAALEAERMAKLKSVSKPVYPSSSRLSLSLAAPQQPTAFQNRMANVRISTPNMLAIMKAKEKIDQIKAAKSPTMAKTVPKATGRIAHVNKELIDVSVMF